MNKALAFQPAPGPAPGRLQLQADFAESRETLPPLEMDALQVPGIGAARGQLKEDLGKSQCPTEVGAVLPVYRRSIAPADERY